MEIDFDSKIPKYIQIRKWLIGMIKRKRFKIGDKLPTEEQIAKEFSVNRMTVRKALDELVIEKMIVRKRGEGTILISDKPKNFIYELSNISSFNDDMEIHGFKPIHKMIKKEVIQADQNIINKLQLKNDFRVIFTMSIKIVDDEPVLIERSYIPYSEFKSLMDIDIEGPFYHLLVERFGVKLHHSTQIFSAVLAGKEESEIFGFNETAPCIFLESITYDENDIPIEVLFSHYRADRYKFKAQLGEYLFQNNRRHDENEGGKIE